MTLDFEVNVADVARTHAPFRTSIKTLISHKYLVEFCLQIFFLHHTHECLIFKGILKTSFDLAQQLVTLAIEQIMTN